MPFAGVVPYTVMPSGGELLVLVAREAFGRDKGLWSCFGGQPDRYARCSMSEAAREAHEESAGLLGTPEVIREAISSHGTSFTIQNGIHYLVPVCLPHCWPFSFQGIRAALLKTVGHGKYSPYLEKDRMSWVPFERLGTDPDMPLRPAFARDIEELKSVLRQIRARHAPVQAKSNAS